MKNVMDSVAVPPSPEVGRNTMTQEMGIAMDKRDCDMLYMHSEMVEDNQEMMMGSTDPHLEFEDDQKVKIPASNIGR